jgi:hypothetical protein
MREFDKEGTVVGTPYQSVMEASTTQKYPIGTLYETFGSRWRYCKAASAITVPHRGCPAMQPASWTAGVMSMGSDQTTVTGAIGDTKVLIFTGADYDLAHALDYFQGGELVIFGSTHGPAQYRIIGSDVSFTSNTYMYIYINPALVTAEAGVACDVMANPYAFVGAAVDVVNTHSVVCVPHIAVASGSFFWGQTKGPCFITSSTEWKTASTREAEFGVGGTIKAGAGVALQHAGFQIHVTTADEDSYIMLKLE